MIRIPGQRGKDLCDSHLGMTRRDVLRVGGSGMLGLTLGGMLEMQAQAKETKGGGPVGPPESPGADMTLIRLAPRPVSVRSRKKSNASLSVVPLSESYCTPSRRRSRCLRSGWTPAAWYQRRHHNSLAPARLTPTPLYFGWPLMELSTRMSLALPVAEA